MKDAFLAGYMHKSAGPKSRNDWYRVTGGLAGTGLGALLMYAARKRTRKNIENDKTLTPEQKKQRIDEYTTGINSPWLQYPALMGLGGIMGNRVGGGIEEFSRPEPEEE